MQLGVVIVRGRSMEPTYHDGDRLIAGYGMAPRLGTAHVVQLPDSDDGPRPLAIKRVTRRAPLDDGSPGWWVERDNPREGVDSWLVGALPDSAMKARILCAVPALPPRSAATISHLRRKLHRLLGPR